MKTNKEVAAKRIARWSDLRATASGLMCWCMVAFLAFGASSAFAEKRKNAVTKQDVLTGRDEAPQGAKPAEPHKVPDAAEPAPVPALDVKGPKAVITVDETVHDFGSVWSGPTLQHSFSIKNTGDAPLEIKKVKPSCGCTIAGTYPNTIAPGDSGSFPFSMNSSKLRSRFEKSITISSNDPVTPELRLRLKGEVKNYVDMVPDNANFGRVIGQEPQERVLNITNNTDKPLQLTLDPPADSKFKFELSEKEKGQKFELRVTAQPPFQPGQMTTTVKLTTNIELQPALEVVATANIPERLDIQPPSITVTKSPEDAAAKDSGLTRVIRFTNYGATPVKVLEAVSDDPENVKVTLNERTPGQAYTVTVNMPASYEPPTAGRTITLKTDDKEKPEVKIPVLSGQRPRAAEKTAKRPAEEMIGKPAPSFSTTTLEGKSLANTDSKDSVLVLDFFATNCGFCKKQIPRLETVRKEYEGKPVRFVTVNQTMRGAKASNDDVMAKIKEMNFNGEVVNDGDNTIGPLFAANSYPTMIVIGKSGNVEAVNVGNMGDLETQMKTQLDALIAGKPIPADAQPAQADLQAKPTDANKPAPAKAGAGSPAPAFALKTIDGKDLSNATVATAPATILNFYAPNCGFCKKQIPRLEEIRKKYAEKGVRVVNVTQKMRKDYTQDEVVALMKELGYQGELAMDMENKVGPQFGASGFPTMAVLGKSGKIEAVNVGNIADLETRLSAQLDALIEGKPVPQVAEAKPEAPKPAAAGAGSPAPAIDVKTIADKPITNATFAEAPATVLNFFAGNCGFCKKQIPRLETVRKKFAEKGVRFVNVAESMRKEFTQDELTGIMKELGWEGELALDMQNKYGGPFGANGFPTMVVVGKSGKIEAVNVGNIADLETRLESQLDALISGKPIPQAAASPPAQQPAKRPAEETVGKPAPTFALQTIDGKPFDSGQFAKGPATVLNFVAPNCGFCKKQLPTVEKIRTEYEAKGVRFVAVSQTMRQEFTQEQAVEVFKGAGSNLELAIDKGNQVGQLFKATSYPTMVVVDKNGTVAAVNIGARQDLETVLKGQLDNLIAGKPATP